MSCLLPNTETCHDCPRTGWRTMTQVGLAQGSLTQQGQGFLGHEPHEIPGEAPVVTRPGILKAQMQGMEVHSPSVCKPYVCIAMCTPGWLGGLQAMPGARGKATLTLVGMLGPGGGTCNKAHRA